MISNFVYLPFGQYLFKRDYSLAIQQGKLDPLAKEYGTLGVNPAPLRIKFDVDKTLFPSPNKCKFEIYNMSSQSRQNIKKGFSVRFKAGYKNLVETLVIGNIANASSKREGADIVTTLECGDGESSIVFAKFSNSYPENTPLFKIVQDIAIAMGLDAGPVLGIPEKIFGNGFSFSGTCSDALTKLLRGMDVEWSVQNGAINIIPVKKHNGSSAQIVSQETGLIGVPSNNVDFVQFTSLLNPKLVPGCPIKLTSRENTSLNGFYKIRRSHYEGDSHDSKWQVACEAIPIPAVQLTPESIGFNYAAAVTA